MSSVSPEITKQDLPPQAVLMQMLMGFITSQAISVAARLYIADHLKNGGKTVEELAEATQTHAPSLYRLMRALTSAGVFAKDAENRFTNTPLGDALRSDHPASMRAGASMICDREHWQPHGNLMHSVKTGETAFDHTFGMPVFPYFAENPGSAEKFDDAMTSFSNVVGKAVAETYDFTAAQTIADIGGGHGLILSTVLQANPEVKGILFDQPYVVEGADQVLKNTGVEDRVERIGGDFFKEIPVKADVYLMKFIIHDWNDEQSVTILKNLAQSAEPGARLLLIETVVEEDDHLPSVSKLMDLNMLAMTGGKERTPSEYAELFEQTGFKLTNVIYMPSPLQIVEAVRV